MSLCIFSHKLSTLTNNLFGINDHEHLVFIYKAFQQTIHYYSRSVQGIEGTPSERPNNSVDIFMQIASAQGISICMCRNLNVLGGGYHKALVNPKVELSLKVQTT
jgi:hypothetical protein